MSVWERIGRAAAFVAALLLITWAQSVFERWAGDHFAAGLYGFLVFVAGAVAAWRLTISGIKD